MKLKFNKLIAFCPLLLTVCSLIFTNIALADNQSLLGPLVPSCSGEGGVCTYCDFLAMAQSIIKFLMEVSIPIGVIFIIYGSIMLMVAAGAPERAQNARKIITSAIIGVAIALCAWLIVNTIFIVLAKGNIVDDWWKLNCNPVNPVE
jgi:hypothetical protein